MQRERYRIAVAAAAAAVVALGAGLYYFLLAYGRAQAGSPKAKAVSTRATSAPELLARAGAYLRRHQESNSEQAIELYRRALQLEPENPQALAGLSLALAQRATKLNRGGEREQAMELARRALALDPRLAWRTTRWGWLSTAGARSRRPSPPTCAPRSSNRIPPTRWPAPPICCRCRGISPTLSKATFASPARAVRSPPI